jgi:hypothetical protein
MVGIQGLEDFMWEIGDVRDFAAAESQAWSEIP